MKSAQFKELVLSALEHERGGVLLYQAALDCTVNSDLHEEWERYLDQTKTHVTSLEKVCDALGYDPTEQTPACKVAQHTGNALVGAIRMAVAAGDPDAAELVACECVLLAETKDHANWELLAKCAEELTGEAKSSLKEACERIEDEEDEHLYHNKGWARELWFKALELSAVLPPPEEVKNVKSAIAAARAQQESESSRPH